jgi:diketogulonate reductase-like aldo/keto reductase
MEQIKKSGKTRSIGVSNYLRPHIEATLKTAVEPPVINQLEYHPYLQRANGFVPWMQQNGIQVASYKGLTPAVRCPQGPLYEPLAKISKAHGRDVSAAAILLAWMIQTNIVAVTTTTKTERLDEYALALGVTLTPEEVQEISDLGATYHLRMSWVQFYENNDRS